MKFPIRCRLQSEGWRLWTSILFCSEAAALHAVTLLPVHPFMLSHQTLRWRPRHLLPSITPSRTLFRMFWCLLTWPKYLSFLDLYVFHQGLGNIQMIKDILICSLHCPWNTAQASVDPYLECSQPFNIYGRIFNAVSEFFWYMEIGYTGM